MISYATETGVWRIYGEEDGNDDEDEEDVDVGICYRVGLHNSSGIQSHHLLYIIHIRYPFNFP